MKLFQGFKLLEFSKKIAVVVILIDILSFIFTNIAYMVWNKDITFILEYAHTQMLIIISAYILKSGAENLMKINISDMFRMGKKSTTEETTINNQTNSQSPV